MKKFWTATSLPRSAPGARHEAICDRLHAVMTASVANLSGHAIAGAAHPESRFPAPRRSAPTWRWSPWPPANSGWRWKSSAATIISADTVVKKELYEEIRVPRLWMVDPRYDNVEIYHSTEWGLALKGILAGSEVLAETLIPEFQIVIAELFAAQPKAD